MLIERSIAQITYLKIQTNMQLMLLIVLEPTGFQISKRHYNFIGDVAINKHSTIYTNDNINVT